METMWTHVTIVCGCTSDTCHLRWSMYHYPLANMLDIGRVIKWIYLIFASNTQSTHKSSSSTTSQTTTPSIPF